MEGLRIQVDRERLVAFCRDNQIRRLAFFGSVLRDDFGPESDVDVLVEFEPGTTLGYRYIRIIDDLSKLLGRRVDLMTPNSIRPAYRDEMLSTARDFYVAA
jgi:hypothetical protein